MPAVSTERLHLCLGSYSLADVVGPGGGADDENEGIATVEVPLAGL